MKIRELLRLLLILMASVLLILMQTPSRPLWAQSLVSQTFRDLAAPDWTFGALPGSQLPFLTSANGTDPVGDGWLRLTSALNNQAGFAIYDNAFPSTAGVVIEFDYSIWGGTGADGFAFFLLDGSFVNPQVGAFGGSLGYAQRQTVNGTVDGLSRGYVGIGFDEFGNYSNATEGRDGGVVGPANNGRSPDSIAIRGSGSGMNGYQYLGGATVPFGVDFENTVTRPVQTGTDFRRARIIITPDSVISVEVQVGANAPYVTVINNFDLDNQPGQTARPPTFRAGFSASTGARTHNHEVRNFSVAQPIDVSIVKTHSGVFSAGQTGVFNMVVTNSPVFPNFSPAAGPITVVDTLPAGLTFVSGGGTGWSGCSAVGQVVTCEYPGTLASNTSTALQITVQIDSNIPVGTNLTNVARVITPGDVIDGNNVDDDVVSVVTAPTPTLIPAVTATPDPGNPAGGTPGSGGGVVPTLIAFGTPFIPPLPPGLALNPSVIRKSASPMFALPGSYVTWTLQVSNPETTSTSGTVVQDTMPAEIEILSVNPDAFVSGQQVTWNLGTLDPGHSVTLTISTRIRSSTRVPYTLANLACVTNQQIRSPQCARAAVVSVSTLPSTGMSPLSGQRVLLLVVSVMCVVVLCGGAVAYGRTKQ